MPECPNAQTPKDSASITPLLHEVTNNNLSKMCNTELPGIVRGPQNTRYRADKDGQRDLATIFRRYYPGVAPDVVIRPALPVKLTCGGQIARDGVTIVLLREDGTDS